MQDIQHRQEYRHDGQIAIGNVQRLHALSRVRRQEPGQDPSPEAQHGSHDAHRCNQGDSRPHPHPSPDPAYLTRAQILSGIGGHGIAVGGGGHLQNPVQLVGGGDTGDERDPEAVDDGLHDHPAHGDHRVLECHGQSEGHEPAAEGSLQLPVLPSQPQHLNPADMPDTVSSREALRDQCGDCRPLHAPAEAHDEQEIQHDIGQRGNHHGDQGLPAIAQGPQDSRRQVVHHDHRQPREQDTQIRHGNRTDLLGRPEQRHHRSHCRFADQRQRRRAHSGQDDGIGDDLPQLPVLARAEFLGHQDGEALGKALDDPQGQPVQPVHRPQRGQRIHPQHLAHHGGIHHGIHLLEDVPRHQGKGEQEQQLPGRPFRQCFYIFLL